MHYWFIEIFEALIKEDVKFVIAGGIAVNLLGVPRFTADLDLIIALNKNNALKFIKCITNLGFRPKAPVNAETFASAANRLQDISDIDGLKKLQKELNYAKKKKS
jgi:hypothetical protein